MGWDWSLYVWGPRSETEVVVDETFKLVVNGVNMNNPVEN